MTRLSGKTAVVTGGGRGLGSAISTAFAAEGAHVLVVNRNREAADVIVAEIKASGGSSFCRDPGRQRIETRSWLLAVASWSNTARSTFW